MMNIKKMAGIGLTTLALNLSLLADVNAATIDVKCEVRSGRSKISVDGAGYASGYYRARVASGTGAIWAKAFKRPVAGELEFDFDSNPADIRAGATAIPAAFIKNRTVNGRIYFYNTATRTYALRSVLSDSCRAR